ncbi:hypothetical protein D3C79_822810 [compost metagenome]
MFLARCHVFRHLGQGLKVGALQFLAAQVVAQYPLGHSGQERPWFDQLRRLAGLQQAYVGVLRQVRGTLRAAQAAAQPAGQPVVMGVKEAFDR